MNEPSSPARSRSFGRTALAVIVVLIGAYLLLGFVVHIVSALFGALVLVAAAVAVIWALKVLF